MVNRMFSILIVFVLVSSAACAKQIGTVKNVVDGDTVILADGRKVRLIGVDTPEHHMSGKLRRDSRLSGKSIAEIKRHGLAAKRFTEQLVSGKRIRIEYDDAREDRYGRTLAYLYLDDGTFVNEEIVRQGYGFAYTKYPFKYMDQFREAEREARETQRGLWADGGKI